LEALKQTHAVDVHWHSFELRPQGSPPMPAAYRARIEQSRPRMEQMAREIYGVEMNPGPFGVDSLPALVGGKFAEAQGRGAAYHARMMRAYWDEAQKIDDPAVLAQLAAEVGLDAHAFNAALQDPAYIGQVDADIALAAQYGLTGVPALILDSKYLVSGAQPADALRRIIDQVAARRDAPPPPESQNTL
jgi:predicted DsbA family dithiol-disulfide isomerase